MEAITKLISTSIIKNEILPLLKGKVFKNLVSLLSSQVINFILPLITYPYIIAKIGLDHFGKITIIMTTMSFFSLLIDYGNNFIAPKSISLSLAREEDLSQIVSRVLGFRFLALILCSAIIFFYSYLFQREEWLLFLGGLIFLANLAFNTNWFFQGIQKMEFIAIIDVVSKTIFTLLIFFVVSNKGDYIYILPLWGIGGLLSGTIALCIIVFKLKVNLMIPTLKDIFQDVKEGTPIFLSNLTVFLFTNSNIFLLGLLSGNVSVAIYSIADKLAKIPWTLASLYSQVIYPKACEVSINGIKYTKNFYDRPNKLFLALNIIIIIIAIIIGKPLMEYFTKVEVNSAYIVFIILIVSTIFIIMNVPYNQMILIFGKNIDFMKIYFKTALFNLICASILIYLFNFYGAAISHLLTMIVLLFLIKQNYFQVEKNYQ